MTPRPGSDHTRWTLALVRSFAAVAACRCGILGVAENLPELAVEAVADAEALGHFVGCPMGESAGDAFHLAPPSVRLVYWCWMASVELHGSSG